MKKFILLFACFTMIVISCKKDNENPNEVSVVGSWHLFSIIYSLSNHLPFNNIVLTFDAAGKYNEKTNGEITAQGFYSIKYNNADSINQATITYNPSLDNAPSALAFRSHDTLTLIPAIVSTDGYELVYKKQ